MIRLVGLDLDGTLLATDKSLSAANREALERAAASGVYIVPVTGRPLYGLPSVVEDLDFVRYAITSNGAVIYDREQGTALREYLMTAEKAAEILEAAQLPGTICEYFAGGYGHHDDRGWEYLQGRFGKGPLMSYIRQSRKRVDDVMESMMTCGRGIENISTMSLTHEEQEMIRQKVMMIAGVRCIIPCPTDLEITSAEADKGTALLQLADLMGIRRDEVMAMGDGDNDYSMMKAAGISVAVANADRRIMEAADHRAPSNDEDGVADAVDRFVLTGR